MSLKLMLLTRDTEYALIAESAGVDRIFLDLEYLNKRERQRGRNTVISSHEVEDIRRLRAVLGSSDLLVRTNPINPYLREEIDKAVDYGADILMLPMAIDTEDVETYVDLVKARARVTVMIETPQSLARIRDLVACEGVDEIFIGLNDLHIGLGLDFMFEVLSGGLVEYLASGLVRAGMPFGFGGIARIGEGLLPAEYIIGEHYRLGSETVILSRTFNNDPAVAGTKDPTPIDLSKEVRKIREKEKEISNWDLAQFERNRELLVEHTNKIVRMAESRNRL